MLRARQLFVPHCRVAKNIQHLDKAHFLFKAMPVKRPFGAVAGQAGDAGSYSGGAPVAAAATAATNEGAPALGFLAPATGGGGVEGVAENNSSGVWMKLAIAAMILACLFVLARNALRMIERKMLFPGPHMPVPFADALKGPEGARYARLGVRSYTVPQDDGASPIRYFAAFPLELHPSEYAGSVVVLHGNACSAAECTIDMVPALTSARVAVFFVEYPGYASDPLKTKPSECTLLDNAVRAIDHLTSTRHAPADKPLVLFGISLGCAVATYAASQRPRAVHGLFLLAPFTSVADLVATRIPHVPFKWIIKSNFNAGAWARRVVCPVTIAHGTDDVIVPLHLGEKLAAQFAVKPNFVLVERGGHNDMLVDHPDKIWPACRSALAAAAAFDAIGGAAVESTRGGAAPRDRRPLDGGAR